MLKKALAHLFGHQHGIQHAEEALLLALIVIAAVVGLSTLGTSLRDIFQLTADAVGGSS